MYVYVQRRVINFSPLVRLQSLVKYLPTVEIGPGSNAHLHSWCSADTCDVDHIDVRFSVSGVISQPLISKLLYDAGN